MRNKQKRMHFDLRTQAGCPVGPGMTGHEEIGEWRDMSQRILNVMMPETVVPIHLHNETAETVIICRGAVREEFYDDEGRKIAV